MPVNVDRLRAELQFITDNPDAHQQDRWLDRTDCGTAGCIAGWAVEHHPTIEVVWNPADEDGSEVADLATHPFGIQSIFEAAQAILGLTHAEASRLFDADNTIADLWRIASEITDGAIQAPASGDGAS